MGNACIVMKPSPLSRRFSSAPKILRAGAFAIGLSFASLLSPPPALAQFVCQDTGGSDGGAHATGNLLNVACGTSANADGSGSILPVANTALGSNANARGDFGANTSIGTASKSFGDGSGNVAIGDSANATGTSSNNVAIGAQAASQGNSSFSIAIGSGARALGDNVSNTAVGASSTANGANASAFGNSASANFSNSAAFGNGATATRADQQSFGTATNTYTMAGIASTASRAAQTGPTQLVTSDATGNLATTTLASLGLASVSDLAGINSRLAGLDASMNDLYGRTNRAYSGVAMAFAMAGVPSLLPDETFAMAANYGTFLGTNGVALNAAYRLGRGLQVNGGIAYGVDERIAGGRLGIRMGW